MKQIDSEENKENDETSNQWPCDSTKLINLLAMYPLIFTLLLCNNMTHII